MMMSASLMRPKPSEWSKGDDDLLRKHIRIYGLANWKVVANVFKGEKTPRQCRHRWTNILRAFKTGPWTSAEDQLLLMSHAKYGNKWTKVCRLL